MSHDTIEIVVPGSTSNLGPAFDALSVALDLYLRVAVVDVIPERPDTLVTTFAGASPAGENRIETAFRAARNRFGIAGAGLAVHVSCDIPMTAGLGSSAAATIAGLKLYELAADTTLGIDDMLSLACRLEGHPDNAAASLLGGLTVSCETAGGRVVARSWAWPADVRLVVATPEVPLATRKARAVLPASIPLRDAVANLQRALLLVRALETGQYGDLREALRDRWHQPARQPLVPGLAEAIAIDDPAVLGVCLSGAGPSIVAFAAPGREQDAAAALGAVLQRLKVPHAIRILAAHQAALPPVPRAAAAREKTA